MDGRTLNRLHSIHSCSWKFFVYSIHAASASSFVLPVQSGPFTQQLSVSTQKTNHSEDDLFGMTIRFSVELHSGQGGSEVMVLRVGGTLVRR